MSLMMRSVGPRTMKHESEAKVVEGTRIWRTNENDQPSRAPKCQEGVRGWDPTLDGQDPTLGGPFTQLVSSWLWFTHVTHPSALRWSSLPGSFSLGVW